MWLQKERDAKEARQLDLEIKRQQGREAKQQLFRKRELERRDQSRESADGPITGEDQKPSAQPTQPAAAAAASDGQPAPPRKNKLQIIQSLRQESSTESETQSYTEFRGWVNQHFYDHTIICELGDKEGNWMKTVVGGRQMTLWRGW